jgi:hypothetical protein
MTYIIVLLAVLARFAPHPTNFSPVYGALLFGGVYLKRRDSVWYPLLLLGVSDILLTTQVHHMRFSWFQFLGLPAFAAIVLIGYLIRSRVTVWSVLVASVAAATIFFILNNFAVWLAWGMYPPTGAGLVACYVAALPFFGNTLLSSVLFSAALFGVYEFYTRKAAARQLGSAVAHGG